MADPKIKTRGFTELRDTIKAAQRDLADMTETNREVASYVLARTRAPHRSGRLAATGRVSGTKSAAIIRFGTRTVNYVQPIHWGWGRRNIPANPFLTRAGRVNEPGWVGIYSNRLEEIIQQIEGTQE